MPIQPISSPPLSVHASHDVAEHAAEAPLPTAPLADSASQSVAQHTPAAPRDPREQANKGQFNLVAILGHNSAKPRPKLKGFNPAEALHMDSLPEDQQAFLIEHHATLKGLKFKPLDMLRLAVQLPEHRDFVIESGQYLKGFTPTEINSCALLPREQRDFIAQHHQNMHRLNWPPREMFKLADAPQEHHEFFIRNWGGLLRLGLHIDEMHQFARMPSHARDLLADNVRHLETRYFTRDEWISITGFNEHQCNRLIRESSRLSSRTNRTLIHDISSDSAAFKWPEDLNWLDATSRTSIRRWAIYGNMDVSRALVKISEFCNDALPANFLAQLHKDPTAQPLGALVAGLVFTAGQKAAMGLDTQRAKAVLGYLEEKNDPTLWKDTQAEAKDAIERCGDRVDYGFARVEQVIERHKMALGELPPATVLRSVLRHFNQEQVEIAAQVIALEKGTESESVEVFMSLAGQLAQQGVDMGKLPNKGLYTNNFRYRVEPSRVTKVKSELDNHRQKLSPEFRAAFAGDLAAQSALRSIFPADYQAMVDERDGAEDAASDALLNPASSDTQKRSAQQKLERLGSREPDWYSTKAQEALAS